MTSDPPALSILLGTLNRRTLLEQALRSMLDGTRLPLRILVADAGSTDGTLEFLTALARDDARVEPLFEGERRGQAASLNTLGHRATTKYVCWLSDDNRIIPGSLDGAVAALEADASIGMVGLKVRDLQGPFVDAPYIGGISSTGIINVNQGVLSAALLREVGGFSECFRDYGIDADLTTKILLTGHSVVFTRDVAVLHERGWPGEDTPEGASIARRNARYHRLYARKYGQILGPSLAWTLSRAVWRAARAAFPGPFGLDSKRPVAGFIARDWHNMLAGRFVSPLAEWLDHGAPVHLRQRIPARLCTTALPPEPEEATT